MRAQIKNINVSNSQSKRNFRVGQPPSRTNTNKADPPDMYGTGNDPDVPSNKCRAKHLSTKRLDAAAASASLCGHLPDLVPIPYKATAVAVAGIHSIQVVGSMPEGCPDVEHNVHVTPPPSVTSNNASLTADVSIMLLPASAAKSTVADPRFMPAT